MPIAGVQYEFTSLEDIAHHFEILARNSERLALSKGAVEMRILARETNTWRAAATLLRHSRIVTTTGE